jgi:CBS domain containing-hemolysin-like protein
VTSTLWLWVLETLWRGVPVWIDGMAAVVVAGVLVFSFGEALPRALVAANPESMGLSVARGARAVNTVFYPLARELWKSKQMKRGTAYKWMQKAMNLSSEQAHIGMFNEDQCWELIKRVKEGNANE